jgi:serine/threonine protein kinase
MFESLFGSNDLLFWEMEARPTLKAYFNELSEMPQTIALPRVIGIMRAICTANYQLNVIGRTIHGDIKPENVLVDEYCKGYLLTTGPRNDVTCRGGGFLELASPGLRCKYIDYGSGTGNSPGPYKRPGTPEFTGPEQLLGWKRLKYSVACDHFATGCLLQQAANQGINLWCNKYGKWLECPDEFFQDLVNAVDFNQMRLDDKESDSTDIKASKAAMRRRIVDALFRYILFTYTECQWVLDKMIEMSPMLDALKNKLSASEEFNVLVETFSLLKGKRTEGIRTCPLFENESAAIVGFFSMFHPCPHDRWVPEQFVQLLHEENIVNK